MTGHTPAVDRDAIASHLELLFRKDVSGFVCLRGIGEKGTEREGIFREDIFLEPAALGWGNFVNSVFSHALRWGSHNVATFIVPCTLKAERGTAENCDVFKTVCADFDTGDTDSKLAYAEKYLGEASMVVLSGGTTEEGKPKRHAYWSVFPNFDVGNIVSMRDAIARKCGADIQFGIGVESNPFGRSHQPIRVAGSIHGKSGVKRVVQIERTFKGINSNILVDSMSMPPSPWALKEDAEKAGAMFKTETAEALVSDVVAGAEGTTRWSAFSSVAGHYMHVARRGDMSVVEAKQATYGWMQAHMDPPWGEARFDSEWQGLLRKDLSTHGPMVEPEKPIVSEGQGLSAWATHRWSLDNPPERQFLVDRFVQAGKHQLLVAEGGAGKTFMMLDLALKVSSKVDGDEWCGMPVVKQGAVVILTTEDDKDELHIRLSDMDPAGVRRKRAGDNLIILPTINSGGSFAFVDKDPKTQEARPSRKWLEFFNLLKQIPNLQLVVIDTLNSVLHGEENSATVINEFIRVVSQIGGELGAALIVIHHIRKQGDEPIRNAEQMAAASRGSSAILSSFRGAIGVWHAPDFDRRMKGLGEVPKKKQLWKAAIIKANNPQMFDGERTLLRTAIGTLVDVTDRDKFNDVNFQERHAWLMAAVTLASRNGHPYSIEGKNAKSGLYRRRSELPDILKSIGPGEFAHLVDDLMMNKRLAAAAAKGGKEKKWLDIPNGPIASDEAGAEMNSGAYDSPNWDEYVYDIDAKEVIRKS